MILISDSCHSKIISKHLVAESVTVTFYQTDSTLEISMIHELLITFLFLPVQVTKIILWH